MEAWMTAIILVTISAGLSYSFFYHLFCCSPNKRLPPSPLGLPLLGHLHMLGDLPHRSLEKLSRKHGPIMLIRLGPVPAIVVSSPEYAEIFLKTHDAVFASRPKIQAAEYISYGQKNIVLAQYGPYWRSIRKLCTLELLTSAKIDMFKPMRREELANFVESIKDVAQSRSRLDVTEKIGSVIEDMAYRMILGFKDDKFNIKSTLEEGVRLGGAFNVGDYFHFLRPFDLQGFGPRMQEVKKVLDGFMEKIMDEHLRDAKEVQGQHRDFMDVMLSLMQSDNTQEVHLERDHVKAIMLDLLAASMDTSSTAVEWVITYLLKHPRVMKLVQEELEHIVGLDRIVEETDLSELDYLKMVIKETMRIHPVTPFLVPHESIEDITINGYFIPKNSRILVNTWAIGRDQNVWSDNAEEFYPERFTGSNIDIQGHDFQFLPFGSGRRKCPGVQLGMTVVQMVVAQLVHCFDLELPDGMSPDDLGMEEKFGLTLPRANHLEAIPTYRLHIRS